MSVAVFGGGREEISRTETNTSSFSRRENSIFRLRKWLVTRLSSIIDNQQVKRQEDLVMDVAR